MQISLLKTMLRSKFGSRTYNFKVIRYRYCEISIYLCAMLNNIL